MDMMLIFLSLRLDLPFRVDRNSPGIRTATGSGEWWVVRAESGVHRSGDTLITSGINQSAAAGWNRRRG